MKIRQVEENRQEDTSVKLQNKTFLICVYFEMS